MESRTKKSKEMSWNDYKSDAKGSEYKGVSLCTPRKGGPLMWLADLYFSRTTSTSSKMYDTEHEAAKAVDLHLIGQGQEPVNVLKRK